ncbi:MAG: argininosuccinate lyase [Candidatus Dormibacteraceae bacterium]
MDGKLWGSRLDAGLLPELERFASSLELDRELWLHDVDGSRAHARGLAEAGLISPSDLAQLEAGLDRIRIELIEETFTFAPTDEDIHTAVERRLVELVPEAAGRLHAGRSRNDQVALDLRLYCRRSARSLTAELASLIEALAASALDHAGWRMPGYTHLQRAQPVTAGHVLLAHAEPLLRDAGRLRVAFEAAGEMPLGSGALAGSTLPLRRRVVAAQLGFARLTQNSIDAVADRDFALDLAYACLTVGLHLSRLAEDIVLWSTVEFGFLEHSGEVSTGSSLMPQKRNPDVAELLRGRSGRALGSLVGLATVLKGLPLAYDRDLQEDRVHLVPAVANALQCLAAARLLVGRLRFNRGRLEAACADPDLLATDTAEAMVAAGAPFRLAHGEVGRQVREGTHVPATDAARSLRRRDLPGGPHPRRVEARARVVAREAARLRRWAGGAT